MSTPDLGQVAALCTRMRATSVGLFETLGGWVTTTEDADHQRLFATASHRHAWHAQLWADRAPLIPATDVAAEPADGLLPDVAGARRADEYGVALDRIVSELEAFAGRVDPLLDPSTQRVIDLVTTDLVALRAQLA